MNPQTYTVAIFALYAFIWFVRKIGTGERQHGVVIDKKTGLPLSFGVVEVLQPGTNVLVRKSIADALGRYYCLVTKGEYKVAVSRKTEDGKYAPTQFSIIAKAPRGVVRERLVV